MITSALDRIVQDKRKEIEESKKAIPIEKLRRTLEQKKVKRRNFRRAITEEDGIRLIAEIKKASPSMGVIREEFNALEIAQCYEDAGAAALSVLTETKYFLGRPSYLETVREVTTRPLLRKDFLIDEYQIIESAVLGSDAALLIAAILGDRDLKYFIERLQGFEIDPLVEVHTEEELDRALSQGATIIGINNRNLKTMMVDLLTTERLMKRMPERTVVVAESGINCFEQIKKLSDCGVHAFLVGTSILKEKDMRAKILELRGVKK